MYKSVFLVLSAVAILLLFWKVQDFINIFRIKRGLPYRIFLTIHDDTTILCDIDENVITIRSNDFIFVDGERKKGVLQIGDIYDSDNLRKKYSNRKLKTYSFVKEFDEVMLIIDDFWYQFITYYALFYKRLFSISAFTVVSMTVNVDIKSEPTRNIVIQKIKEVEYLKRPKLFNIIDVC